MLYNAKNLINEYYEVKALLLTIIAAIFVFGLLVLVHEFGHFITAKMTGMRVDEFAIGFGPKLLTTKRGETVYSIRAIPLGGFNDIAGMDPTNNEAGDRGYCNKPVLSRMFVILAGSVMNFILPVILFFGIFFFTGMNVPSTEPVIGAVIENKPAALAGLKDGDKIIRVNDNQIATWSDFVTSIKDVQKDQSINITYERGNEILETNVTPVYDNASKRMLLGVQSKVDNKSVSFFEAVKLSLTQTYEIIAMMIAALIDIFISPSQADLAGPIGIAQMAGKVAESGFVPLLNFAALLSLNLGIINLLPVPALDGGHFVTLALEAVRGKPLSPKAIIYTQRVGVALLLLLMIFATKNDIIRVFFS